MSKLQHTAVFGCENHPKDAPSFECIWRHRWDMDGFETCSGCNYPFLYVPISPVIKPFSIPFHFKLHPITYQHMCGAKTYFGGWPLRDNYMNMFSLCFVLCKMRLSNW